MATAARTAPKGAERARRRLANRTQPDGTGALPRRWRNRIIGNEEVDPQQLLANPANWRIHPTEQQDALANVLNMVGWVQDVVVNKRTGFIVDGHARVGMAIKAGERVPVAYVDLSEEEERLVLATFDRIGDMAGIDEEKLDALIEDAVTGFDVARLLEGIDVSLAGQSEEVGESETKNSGGGGHAKNTQSAELEFRVVVECRGEVHQAELLQRFRGEGLVCRALIS